MKRPKLKRYPKKPKASAPLAVQENWLHRVKEIDNENFNKVNNYKKSKKLAGLISGTKQKHHNWGEIKSYPRKASVKKHKRRVSGVKKKRTTRRKRR